MAKIQDKGNKKAQRGPSQFSGKPCGVCGGKTRPMNRPTWWVCECGHRLVRKN